jgi:hypothetical protein
MGGVRDGLPVTFVLLPVAARNRHEKSSPEIQLSGHWPLATGVSSADPTCSSSLPEVGMVTVRYLTICRELEALRFD